MFIWKLGKDKRGVQSAKLTKIVLSQTILQSWNYVHQNLLLVQFQTRFSYKTSMCVIFKSKRRNNPFPHQIHVTAQTHFCWSASPPCLLGRYLGLQLFHPLQSIFALSVLRQACVLSFSGRSPTSSRLERVRRKCRFQFVYIGSSLYFFSPTASPSWLTESNSRPHMGCKIKSFV